MAQPPEDSGATQAAIRDWVGDATIAIYRDSSVPYRNERATVQSGWVSQGLGWPQTVGEPPEPAKVQIRPDRYEIMLVLPPEVPEEFAREFGDRLRELAEHDQTLGGRVRAAEIPKRDFEPEIVSDQDYGEGAHKLTIPVTIYELETAEVEDGE